MKTIAFPVTEDAGVASLISAHFGHAPYFAIADRETGSLRIEPTSELVEVSECAPLRALRRMGVEAVFCRSMGRGALVRCRELGIQVFEVEGCTVGEALDNLQRGAHRDLPDEQLCGGHDNGTCAH